MVAVRGFDHHRQADVLGGLPGLFGTVDNLALGHRHAAGGQQAFGQVLVVGNAFGNRAGEVGLGGPDAALAGAVAELHQVALVQADVGNAPVGGGRHDGGSAGADIAVVHLGADFLGGSLYIGRVVGLAVDGGHQQPVAFGEGRAGHLLVPGPKDHAVGATPG